MLIELWGKEQAFFDGLLGFTGSEGDGSFGGHGWPYASAPSPTCNRLIFLRRHAPCGANHRDKPVDGGATEGEESGERMPSDPMPEDDAPALGSVIVAGNNTLPIFS